MTDAAIAWAQEEQGHTLTMTRRFAAPRERVFNAWADSAHIAQWFGPESVKCEVHGWDARPGGDYSLTMHHSDGDTTDLGGTFREVTPHSRLVCTWVWGGDGPMAGRETLLTLDFEADGEATILHLNHALLLNEEWAEKHSMGWGSSFNSLETLLQS